MEVTDSIENVGEKIEDVGGKAVGMVDAPAKSIIGKLGPLAIMFGLIIAIVVGLLIGADVIDTNADSWGYIAAVLAILYIIVLKIVAPEAAGVPGWASVFVAVLFLGGLNAFLTGVVLENLSFVLMQTHGKPTFFEIDRETDEVLRAWFRREQTEP